MFCNVDSLGLLLQKEKFRKHFTIICGMENGGMETKMIKFYNLVKALFEDEINEDEQKKIIEEIKSCDIVKELLPYLFHHRLICLFYSFMVSNNMVPVLTKESWRIITKNIIYEKLKSEEYFIEVKTLCKELNKKNIKYALVKGIHLESFLYEKKDGLIRRCFNDIDLLVEKKDIKFVSNILEGLGYFKGEFSPELNELIKYSREEDIKFLMISHQSAPYIKHSSFENICKGDSLNIDINFSIFDGGNKEDLISTRELLKNRVKRKTIYGNIYYSLNLTHDLLQLVYHLYKDTKYEIKKTNNEQFLLYNFIDIYRFIKSNGDYIDWNYFCSLVKNANVVTEFNCLFKYIANWCSNKFIDVFIKWADEFVNSEKKESVYTS